MKALIGSIAILVSTQGFAQSAADALLQNTKPSTTKQNIVLKTNNKVNIQYNFKLTDPFLIQFFSEWKSQKLPFEYNMWASSLLSHKWEKAAHLLSNMWKNSPQSFKPVVLNTKLYLYFKLGLNQSFIDEYLAHLKSPYFRKSAIKNHFSLSSCKIVISGS